MTTTLSTDKHACMVLLILLPIWLFFLALSLPIIQDGFISATSATALTFALVLVAVTRPPEVSIGRVITYLYISVIFFLSITLIGTLFAFLVRYTVVLPFGSLIEYATTIPFVASAVVLGVAGISAGGILLAVKKTGPAVDWSLVLRMSASLLILSVLTVWFLTAIWLLIKGIVWIGLSLLGIGPDTKQLVAIALTVGLLGTLVYRVYHDLDRGGLIERHGTTTSVLPDEFPDLHSITTTVAAQLDIPMPTISIAEQSEPEAITVGYRPGNIHLILSQGTLDALSDDELEAVIAHELAHVANMDAMVTTVASLPALLADGLQDQFQDRVADISSINETLSIFVVIYSYPLWVITLITTYLSQPVVAVLSRARESAADRTSATVTGSSAALVSALRTLDEQIADTPTEDLRESSSLSALSILPLHPIETDPESDTDSLLAPIAPEWWWRAARMLFATHPPTDRRIAALTALSEERQKEQ